MNKLLGQQKVDYGSGYYECDGNGYGERTLGSSGYRDCIGGVGVWRLTDTCSGRGHGQACGQGDLMLTGFSGATSECAECWGYDH